MNSVAIEANTVPDREQGVDLPVWVLYPSLGEDRTEQIGPYPFSFVREGAPLGRDWPVVIVSHGNNGTPWTHRETARALVLAGFAVVMVEHIGNSRSDGSLARTFENLSNRPRHLRLALDWALGASKVGKLMSNANVYALGHSIGAYTALAAAGGEPSAVLSDGSLGPKVPVVRDERLRALVLLAPAALWFKSEGALHNVNVPVLLKCGERDDAAPRYHSELVLRGMPRPDLVDFEVVAGAGHFSFQSPFPPSMTKPDFPPSQDPPGFDRGAYQITLNRQIVAFLEAQRT